ncbi:hypothetical protein ABTX35_33060 [Streptomyces sp. NPDC096080]|uniref:hypothetical protein n=1 Tax=Streptomyces sp. NPDC096080 TaxID=3156693 RepID=UPI003321463C
MSGRAHGYARYRLDGCRCYTCGWAVAQYNDAVEHARRRGTWQPFTDAAPVREHLVRLRACDMGLRSVAAAAGVDRKRLQNILTGRPERGTGPQKQVRPALAAAVLAVQPTLDTLGAKTVICAVCTTRRLQAAVADGWPMEYVAHRIGWTPGNFSGLIRQPTVTVATARLVRDVYPQLLAADPAADGASPAGITQARAQARREGWAPSHTWDETTLDDPAAHPEWTGECGTSRGVAIHQREGIPLCPRCHTADEKQRRVPAADRQAAS